MRRFSLTFVIFIFCLVSVIFLTEERPAMAYAESAGLSNEISPKILYGVLENGQLLLPIRQIFEHLGADVQWNKASQQVVVQRKTGTVELKIASNIAILNGQPKKIDPSPRLINGNTFVPLRVVSEALGATVAWDQELSAAIIVDTDNTVIFVRPSFSPDFLATEEITVDSDDYLVLVNKKRRLPADYVPLDLVKPNIPFAASAYNRLLRQEAAVALEGLFDLAKQEDIKLVGVSGYRSYSTQQRIFARKAALQGEDVANLSSARPGQSEHQTGLAMDISKDGSLTQSFGKTREGMWVANNAPLFGFIIRYPEGKDYVTGYIYEPWHLRYVGVEAALEISEKKMTLEEYQYEIEFLQRLQKIANETMSK